MNTSIKIKSKNTFKRSLLKELYKSFGITFFFAVLFSMAAVAQKEFRDHKNTAFKQGEVLTYRVHYGFVDAGEARLEVLPEMKSFGVRPCYHVVGSGKSVGAFDWFFKVRDRYESYVDSAAIMPWFFIRRVDEGGYKINQTVTFNHYKNIVTSEKSTLNMPDYLQDLISAFYYARTTDFNTLKIGDVIPIKAWLDDALIPLNVKFIGREVLSTKFGDINCIVLRPLLQQGRVFKENEDLTLWISDDQNKIPVRAEAKILVGSVKMDLKNFSGLAAPLSKKQKN
jgi:hypothetical protein